MSGKLFFIIFIYIVSTILAPAVHSYNFKDGLNREYAVEWLETYVYPTYDMSTIHEINSAQTQDIEVAMESEYDISGQEVLGSEYAGEFVVEEDYGRFRMVLVNDGLVTGAYTNSDDVSIDNINIEGMDRESVREVYGEPEESIKKGWKRLRVDSNEYAVYDLKDRYVYFFYDLHEEDKVNGTLVVMKEEVEAGKELYNHPEAADNSRMNHVLVNATRYEYGVKPLEAYEEAGMAAQGHSEDMAENNYFNHDSPDGETLKDRVDEAGVKYRMAGENIAMGHTSPIFSHHSLMNSMEHRVNTLKPAFTHLGTGTAYNDEDIPYYTENYIQK
ncbi:CAP-associated domain-containing protein [Salinicoccus roseus]|uniref:CAP domain-containing protein n=1 Tax=Salinicoccus roseus TaxID=45670 RepID=UPI0023008695|nr:CAP-associated domain-containing protein [Salinicoccus roseus]